MWCALLIYFPVFDNLPPRVSKYKTSRPNGRMMMGVMLAIALCVSPFFAAAGMGIWVLLKRKKIHVVRKERPRRSYAWFN